MYKKIIYIAPSAEGYLYDSQTKGPIRNTKGYLSYASENDPSNYLITDKNGKF